jgi:hypothetical protein
MHELDEQGRYRFSDFATYTLDIARSEELVRRDRNSRGDREMSTAQMQARMDSLKTQGPCWRRAFRPPLRRPWGF